MEIKVDLTKQIREAIDWIANNVSKIKKSADKGKIDKVIAAISRMIVHKRDYLEKIKQASNNKRNMLDEIDIAVGIAQSDIRNLINTVEEGKLGPAQLGFDLNNDLKSLANQKMLKIKGFNPDDDAATIVK